MRLKRVRIFGFKTFADRTDLEIDQDLIAVVGPNGSGKSNIVDAILWGLGEPNARNLRAATGQDVIFNGSAHRKPIGYAEVSLLFDNEDGALALDAPEVLITRKLTRSGDSSFSINKRSCRLKDVYDLLADSGLGRAGYAIVGQKEIDAALSASAEDRRAWVDEAAGVQRYRMRRQESLRRLQQAGEHLARVDDILREIESQREPLREEAETAKRYKEIQATLGEIESGLLIRELAEAGGELEELLQRVSRCVTKAGEEAARAEALEAEVKVHGEELSELEREMDAVRELRQGALTQVERADAALKLAEQRLRSLDDLEGDLKEQEAAGRERVAEAEAALEVARREAREEAHALDALLGRTAGAGEQAEQAKKALKDLETEIDQAQQVEAEKLRRQAEAHQRRRREREIREELEGVAQSLPDLESGIREAEQQAAEVQAREEAHRKEVQAARDQAQQARKDEESAAAKVRQVLAEAAALEGKRRGLEATLDAHEGLAQGTQAVLHAVDQGLLPDEYRPVAEAIHVEARLARAIEVALGASANDLIVPSEHAAKAAIALLKERRWGRATFQPIPLMRPVDVGRDLESLLAKKGVLGIAGELVECAREDRPVIDSLLGRILVTETLDDALALSRTRGWSRIVTVDGELLHSSGAVTGGQSARQGSGILQRKAELDECIAALDAAAKTVRKLQAEQERLKAVAASCRAQEEAASEKLKALEPDLRDAKNWLASLRNEFQATEKARERLVREREALVAAVSEAPLPEYNLDELRAKHDQLLRETARHAADHDQASERLREAEARAKAANIRVNEAERRLAIAHEGESKRERRLEGLDGERARAKAEIETHAQEREAAQTQAEATATRLEELQDRRRELLEKSFELAEQAKEAQRSSSACSELAHRAELERARADARRANAAQRLAEEFGISEEDAMERAPRVELPDDAAPMAKRLRADLRRLGDVNLGAIEAYERLTQRADELGAQRDDVLQGKAEVEAGIRELDRLTRDKFLGTFEQVRAGFAECFATLFGGGEGKLSLTNPDDLLASGVDVEVTVPGKRTQRLELLSGGERALSACAFLFALLKVKPSPLVVLDEVDAPLDGRNVERFLDLLRSFRGTTQFILITHNAATIVAAPVWFGVTMREPGVSMVVPFRMPDETLVDGAISGAYLKG